MNQASQEHLISLSHRKNEAHQTLIEARYRLYVPSTLEKSTAVDREIKLAYDTRVQQLAYDNLADEYAIKMEAAKVSNIV